MSAGFLHKHILVPRMEEHFRSLGAEVLREHLIRVEGRIRFVDLYVRHPSARIACEIELSTSRVSNDVAKAIALKATLLLIVVPNRITARSVRRKIRTLQKSKNLEIWILTLGSALQRLREKKDLMTNPLSCGHLSRNGAPILGNNTERNSL